MNSLRKTPQTHGAPGFEEPDVRALFYETLPFRGAPTRSFAYLGLPAQAKRDKVPAMVLVHGGGGTAFAEWVRLWTSRGYAAIAMDTCGATSGGDKDSRPRHRWSGPSGWGGWDQTQWETKDQWVYHAVADVILAHSLLRSLPEVDELRVGVTGISWGGFLTNIVAGLDARFALAAPVYGCGFIAENEFFSTFLPSDVEQAKRWLELWEPAQFLPHAAMPMLWSNGTNDFAYPLDVHQKSYRLASGPRWVSLKVGSEHSQPAGSQVPEIEAFVKHFLQGGPPLCRFIEQNCDSTAAWALFEDALLPIEVTLCFTRDLGVWAGRKWEETPARLDANLARAPLPHGTRAYFFNLKDARGLIISSEMQQL